MIFCPVSSPNFMQKIRKTLRVDSEKKILLTNGPMGNTEFTEPFLRQLLCFLYFSLESDSYFSIFIDALMKNLGKIGKIFSAFLLTYPRGEYALPNLMQAQQLRVVASRPVQVSSFWTSSRSNLLYHGHWGRTSLTAWLQMRYKCTYES